jgi:hypothetical protein
VTTSEADPLLRRLERRALVFSAVAAIVALLARRGRPDVALGVAAGGVLIGVSYWAIRSSIDGLLAATVGTRPAPSGGQEGTGSGAAPEGESAAPGTRRGRAIGYMLRFAGRYLVLGALAYVMLVWLRLHPIGLIVGVSSIVVAAALEVAGGVVRRR